MGNLLKNMLHIYFRDYEKVIIDALMILHWIQENCKHAGYAWVENVLLNKLI